MVRMEYCLSIIVEPSVRQGLFEVLIYMYWLQSIPMYEVTVVNVYSDISNVNIMM